MMPFTVLIRYNTVILTLRQSVNSPLMRKGVCGGKALAARIDLVEPTYLREVK